VPDKYELYQRAVQDPRVDLRALDERFRARRGRAPLLVREDFCGTALVARTFLEGDPARRAWGVDIDPEPLGRARARCDEARLTLLCSDVVEASVPKVDAILALNASYFVFKTRDRLRAYFARARDGLLDGGALVLEVLGGYAMHGEGVERTAHDGFTYVWRRAAFDAISHDLECRISFELDDGTALHDAFVYDWRLWSIPELRELLAEAGFALSEVCWEGPGDRGEGDRCYRPRERARAEATWTAYVVGWR
jgi:SAM-dependent methyltransferase